MTTQVITITPEGGLSGLQVKRGRGLDLKSMGHAEIDRASEIVWNEPQQCWHVHVLNEVACQWMAEQDQGIYVKGGWTLGYLEWGEAVTYGYCDEPKGVCDVSARFYGFEEYDDAVAAEIKFLNALRTQGIF